MKNKNNQNDPLAELRSIDAAQSAASFTSEQPTDGNSTKEQPVEEKARTIDEQEESKKWSDRFEVAKTYQLPLFEKWAKWYDDMYAHVSDPGLAPWRSKVYMPIISSKVWDLISRFIQYRPGWDVTIRTLPVNTLDKDAFNLYMEDMNKKAEKVRMKLNYDYDCPLMDEPIQDELLGVMLDAAVTGQGVGRAPYLSKTTEYKQYMNSDQGVDYSKVKNDTAQEGYNAFTGVNIFNFFLKPGTKGLQKSPWVVIADQVPLYELEKDPKIDKAKLKLVKSGAVANEFARYEASRNRLITTEDAGSLDNTTQMVQTYECWDKEFNELVIYGVGEGWVELYRGSNVYWHKKYPLVPFYIRRKPYQFWGESIFENSETLQSAINDVFNHFMDSHNMADGMIAIEEGSVVEPYIIEPGGELRYRGELPKQFKFPSPDSNNITAAMNIINGAIENATISQYASGVPNSANDQTQGTATGVTRMLEAAAEKVGFMRANFRRSWREVGQMWLSNTQQFMRADVVMETVKNGEKKNEVIRPQDVMGIFGVKIDDGSFEPISKDQKRQDFLAYVSGLQAWQTSSIAQADRNQQPTDALRIDWNEVALRGSEHFSENASNFILPVVPPPTAEPQAPEAGGELPLEVPEASGGLAEPLPADDVLDLAPGETDLSEQADGKDIPESFPVRNVNALKPQIG